MDEADKFFELGFTSQIKQILEIVKLDNINYCMYSATINHGVEQLANEINPLKIFVGGKNNVLNSIEQKLVYTGNEFGNLTRSLIFAKER